MAPGALPRPQGDHADGAPTETSFSSPTVLTTAHPHDVIQVRTALCDKGVGLPFPTASPPPTTSTAVRCRTHNRVCDADRSGTLVPHDLAGACPQGRPLRPITLCDHVRCRATFGASCSTRRVPRLDALLMAACGLFGFAGALSLFSPFNLAWEQPSAFAALGAVSAVVMMTAAVVSIAVADRHDVAELGLIGNGLLSMSVLAATNAAVTPDALYTNNEAFGTAALLILPAFVLSSLPVLFANSALGRWCALRWRDWSLLTTLAAFIVGFALAGLPTAWPAPNAHGPVSIAVCVASLIAVMALTARAHRRHVTSGSTQFLIMWLALAGLGLTALSPLADVFGLGFWGLRAVGLVSALGLAASTVSVARRAERSQEAFAPVLRVDPFLALDLAASPLVSHHLLTAAGDREVAGTADLALKVADRMKLSIEQRRYLGLATVMHDVGKTLVPVEILNKPGPLSADEFQIVQHHVADGAAMLTADSLLAPCAHIVRSHHERVDGAGYPDGLAGSEIPIEARIIAVCDAFDAITHDREYRKGLQ